jgi:hypothetical protein
MATIEINGKKHKTPLLQKLWVIGRVKERLNKKPLQWQVDICANNDDGSCKAHRRIYGVNNDNWGFLLAGIFTKVGSGGFVTTTFKSSTGSSDSVNVKYGGTVNAATAMFLGAYSTSTVNVACDVYVQLGTGSGTALRTDYTSATLIAGTASVSAAYVSGGSAVVLSATLSYGTAQTPSEVVLMINGFKQSSTTASLYMFDHTYFTALPSATNFTVTYTLTMA